MNIAYTPNQIYQGESKSPEMLTMIFHASSFKLIGLMGLHADVTKQEVLTPMTVWVAL